MSQHWTPPPTTQPTWTPPSPNSYSPPPPPNAFFLTKKMIVILVSLSVLGGLGYGFYRLDKDLSSAPDSWGIHGEAKRIDSFSDELPFYKKLGKPAAVKLKPHIEKNGLRVREIHVVGKETSKDGALWTYQVQTRSSENLVKPEIVNFEPDSDLRLIASRIKIHKNVPAGKILTAKPTDSLSKDTIVTLEYKILVSKEETLISKNIYDQYLTQEEWNQAIEFQNQKIIEYNLKVADLRKDAEKWVADQVAFIPIPQRPDLSPKKWRGNFGTGEPTKTAARAGGAAAAGAAIGSLIGKTEGGLLGALAGAVAGGIYDVVSKSNDQKKFEEGERRRVASEKRAYENSLADYNRQKDAIIKQLPHKFKESLEKLIPEKTPELTEKNFELKPIQ